MRKLFTKENVIMLAMLIGLGVIAVLLFFILLLLKEEWANDTTLLIIVMCIVVGLGSCLVKQKVINKFIARQRKWKVFKTLIIYAYIIAAIIILNVPILEALVNATTLNVDNVAGINIEGLVKDTLKLTGSGIVIWNALHDIIPYIIDNWKLLWSEIKDGDNVTYDDEFENYDGKIHYRDDEYFYIVTSGKLVKHPMSDLQYVKNRTVP